MSIWNPVYRVKVNGSTVTNSTLAGLTINSGRTSIYAQPLAGYCSLSLLVQVPSAITYEINNPVTIEVQDSNGDWVFLFGGFLTDISIEVDAAGSSAIIQRVNIVAVGALARLARVDFQDNLSADQDGDQIYTVLSQALFDTWDEVPAATTWNDYNPATTWAEAENSGLGEIDRPGDYDLASQNNLNESILQLAQRLAISGLGYIYEDSQGRIGYADSTHRAEYLSTNGYVDLDANHASALGLKLIKRAGDVRNVVDITYGSNSNQSVTASDLNSISLYGELSSRIDTTLANQSDAEDQADFYLALRAYPRYEMDAITFEVHSPEIDDTDRDALLNVFMGLPLNIQNLPANMVNGEFQGFVEGWTWRAGLNRLQLRMILSPIAYSLQAFRWNSVPATETWQTISPTMTWLDATIVA